MGNAIKYTMTMPLADIDRGTVSIGKRVQSVRRDIHCLAVSILHNWASSGAANVATDKAAALLAVIDDAHKQKLVNWLAVYAGFEYQSDDASFKYTTTTLDAETFQKAKAETMFELTPDNKPQAYDLRAKVMQLIATAENKRKKGLKEDDNVPAEMIDGLKALIS